MWVSAANPSWDSDELGVCPGAGTTSRGKGGKARVVGGPSLERSSVDTRACEGIVNEKKPRSVDLGLRNFSG